MKRLILFALPLVLIGVIYGIYLYQKPVPAVSENEVDISLAAPALLHAYESDEAASDTKYLDKIIEVNGIIKEVNRSESGEISISLATDNDMSSVICHLDERQLNDNLPEKGQSISLVGQCTGYLMDVILEKCIVNKQ